MSLYGTESMFSFMISDVSMAIFITSNTQRHLGRYFSADEAKPPKATTDEMRKQQVKS